MKADLDLGFGVTLASKKIRLAHVNCPEKDTPEGIEARNFTAGWIMGGKDLVVSVKNHREDKYGRILGSVIMDGESLADLLMINNHGVAYEGAKR